MRYAEDEGRSASNFARFVFLRGLADYEREQAQRPKVLRTPWP